MARRLASDLPPRLSGHPAEPPAESRAEVRSNIFVVAVVYSEAGSVPVRIRNMSRSGALIEGAALPPAKARIRLSRGSLRVFGHIAWNRDGRAGISFETPVAVPDWFPRTNRAFGQHHIDEYVYSIKSGIVGTTAAGATASASAGSGSLADRLLKVRASLQEASEELVADLHLSERHLNVVQLVDAAAQELHALATLLASGGEATD